MLYGYMQIFHFRITIFNAYSHDLTFSFCFLIIKIKVFPREIDVMSFFCHQRRTLKENFSFQISFFPCSSFLHYVIVTYIHSLFPSLFIYYLKKTATKQWYKSINHQYVFIVIHLNLLWLLMKNVFQHVQ